MTGNHATDGVDLKPCPFCGSHANTYSMPGFCRVQCTSCAAQVETEPTCCGLTYAKNLWNRRFTPEPREQQLAECPECGVPNASCRCALSPYDRLAEPAERIPFRDKVAAMRDVAGVAQDWSRGKITAEAAYEIIYGPPPTKMEK